MKPLHLALSADSRPATGTLLTVLDGLARAQPGISVELLLDSQGHSSALARLRILAGERHRHHRARQLEVGVREARAWVRADPRARSRAKPSLSMARALLGQAEAEAASAHLEEALELALGAEETVRRALDRGLVEVADQRDVEWRAYALCGQVHRQDGQLADSREVVVGLEAAPAPTSLSLRTSVRVLRLRAGVARDAGEIARAVSLYFDAVDLLEGASRLYEVDLYLELSAALMELGSPREAGILLATLERRSRAHLTPAVRAKLEIRAGTAAIALHHWGKAERLFCRAARYLADEDDPEVRIELDAARAECWARRGKLGPARQGWRHVHERAPRSSPLRLRAALACLELAFVVGDREAVAAWLRVFRADSRETPLDSAWRATVFGLANVLAAADVDLDTLADARAYLEAAEQSPGLPFRRPWPGARVLVPP